jgi:hypothetical protein
VQWWLMQEFPCFSRGENVNMLKNILAVIGAVTVAAVAYVAFSDHKLTFDELVRKMNESEERLAEAEAAATAKDNDEDDEPETKVEKIKVEDKPTE